MGNVGNSYNFVKIPAFTIHNSAWYEKIDTNTGD